MRYGMRRIFRIAIFVWSMCAIPAAAQSLPSEKDATDLVAKAEQQMDLTGPGAMPFHILAKLHFAIGSASVDGAYELLWESADRYREEFRLGSLSATYLALQDKLYIRRNTPALTYPQWRVRMLMGFAGYRHDASKPDIVKVYKSQIGGEDVTCADLKLSGTLCFSHTGEIVSFKIAGKQLNLHIGLTEDAFINIGAVRFPGHIVSTTGNERLEVQLDKVELVTHFADATFAPPEGASAHDWCAQPEVGTQPKAPLFLPMMLIGGPPPQGPRSLEPPVVSPRVLALYAQVGTDGRVEKLMETHPDGSAKDLITKVDLPMRLATHSCAGKPIEYEEMIEFASQIDPNAKFVPDGGHTNAP
jgi:hypothetical protein